MSGAKVQIAAPERSSPPQANKRRHSHAHTSILGSHDLDESGADLAEQLQQIIADRKVKVRDIFIEWDIDRNGSVSKAEFRSALKRMRFDLDEDEYDQIFDEWDHDQTGSLEFREVHRLLNHRPLAGSSWPGRAPHPGQTGRAVGHSCHSAGI